MMSWLKKLFSKRPVPAEDSKPINPCSESGCPNSLHETCSNKRCKQHCYDNCLQVDAIRGSSGNKAFDFFLNDLDKVLSQIANADIVVRCLKCEKRNRLVNGKADPVCGSCGAPLLPQRVGSVAPSGDRLN